MRERKRRHDDLHRPLGGRGKRHALPKDSTHGALVLAPDLNGWGYDTRSPSAAAKLLNELWPRRE